MKSRKYSFLLFISFCFIIWDMFPQYYTSNDIYKLNDKQKLNNLLIDSISESISDVNKKGLFFNSLSSFFFKKKQIRKAIEFQKRELFLYEKNNIKNADYHNALYVLGYYYKLNKEFKKSLSYYKKTSNLNLFPKKKAQALCEIGFIYRIKGQYLESFNYYDRGIKLLKKHGTKKDVIFHILDLAITSNQMEIQSHIISSLEYLKEAIKIINSHPNLNTSYNIYAIYTSLANLSIKPQINNLKQASVYYKYLINFAKSEKNKLFLAMAYNNYGELLYKQKKDSSLYFLEKSIKIKVEIEPYNSLINAETYRNIANYNVDKNFFFTALKNINNSLNISFNLKEEDYVPSKEQILQTTDRLNISKALKSKILILNKLYLKSKNSKYLNQIIKTVNISDQLVEIILEDSTESSTQFSWRNDVSKIYNYGIYAARVLGDKDLQFQYLEKNKAFLLTQSINDNNYSLNLPNHIVNRELHYKKQILEIENKTLENKQLKDSLFDLKFNYQNFKDSIQLAYPKHFESKQKVQLISLDKVQKTMNDNTIIVSYALQNEEITGNISSGLLISKNKTIPFAISNIDTLQKNLNLYRQLVAKPLNTKEETNQFSKVSHYLYQNLFPKKEIQELIKGKQLTIIPDNQLQNIPFEAFITDTSSNSYLIEDNNISYAYSMSFSDINNNIKRTQTKEFAGFAPINFENQKLTSLEYSEKEINTISNNLNGLSLTGHSVTKDSFFKNATDAKIIHLATHADVSKKPVIHFSKDSLNLHELYTYKNNADLVVLSACETNLGELKKGEGILNLARGFFYSGSKSVVSSLWKVNDVATTSLMTDFYDNLKDHQSKSEALNNAKRDYLKTHTLSEKSPYYWASFILIGDTAPTFESDYTLYYIIGFFVLSLLFLFFFKKRG
ncbi:CHAT domain-containing protein [uncultured Tenacibaculum sp.]|uniref:CHAT domain-containing protein n=1 Tax=uncultured Tenacibaculum sp. TaxID=174713 RepID=UPI0026068724|nr:CHAT domain-containing protein [uncultured Tenacibaculum sp.]